MNFFSNIFKKKIRKHIEIFAPISGYIVNIEDVPDSVFSDKIVGDGIAIEPTDNQIVSPINGKIGKIFETLHAFSIESKTGVQLFVHFGIDTVKLKGKGFSSSVKKNQKVKKGDLIISVDLPFLKKHAKSILTPIIISNIDEIKITKKYSGNVVSGKTIIMNVEKK